MSSSVAGEAVAYVIWDGKGALSLSDPTGHLTLEGNVIRAAKPLTDVAGTSLNLILTESSSGSAANAVNTKVSLNVVAPSFQGQAFVMSQYFSSPTPFLTDHFSTPIRSQIWEPATLVDGKTPNPNSNPNGIYYDYDDDNADPAYFYYGSARRNTYYELQQFSSPDWDGIDPFSNTPGGGLVITARALSDKSYPYSGGFLQYRGTQKTGQQNVCGQARILMDDAIGAFPAFWEYPPPGQGPGEMDHMEAGWDGSIAQLSDTDHSAFAFLTGITSFKHDYSDTTLGSQNFQQQTYFTPNLTQAFHTFSFCHTQNYVVDAIDGIVISTIKTPDSFKNRTWDIMVNYAIGGSGIVPPVPSSYPANMYVDYWTFYSAPQTLSFVPPIGIPGLAKFAQVSSSADGTQVTVPFQPQGSNIDGAGAGERVDNVVTAWKLQNTTQWTNFSGPQYIGNPAIVNNTPPGTPITIGLFQTNTSGMGPPYQINLTTNGTVLNPTGQ